MTIDGTPNYRNGNPDFGMCIALFNGKQPILGLIAIPGLRQMVIAKTGGDAKLLNIAEKVIAKVGYASVLASFSTGNFRVVQGMMGLYFGMSPTIMDVAPAAAIIPAIGGVVSAMQGNPIDWKAENRSYIGAVNPQIHQQFLETLNS